MIQLSIKAHLLLFFSPQKITTKNAFGLHLIDYMTEILKQKDSELTNFKVRILKFPTQKEGREREQLLLMLFLD